MNRAPAARRPTLLPDRAQSALLRALRPLAGPYTVLAARSSDWASATFEGARHRLVLALDGDDADARATRLQAMLAEEELPIAGGFVADIGVVVRMEGTRTIIGIEALTIEEAVL
jgi:hypothetical protein